MKKALAFLIALSLFACKPKPVKVNPLAYDVWHGNKVVFLCDYYTHYLNDLKDKSKNAGDLYTNDVDNPLTKYFESGEYARLADNQFYGQPTDTTGLAGRIAAINNNQDKIEKIIASTLPLCNKYLKNDSITVYIQPYTGGFPDNIVKRMSGVLAVTAGSKQILITIDPDIKNWSDAIAPTLAHEYHHTYWTEMNYSQRGADDMLSYMIFEGRADSYQHVIYPNVISPWDTALSQQQVADYWNKLKTQLHNTNEQFQRMVMFGSMDGSGAFPIWGGYCLGYNIVQSALKNNPNLTPEQWTDMTPEQILKLSDYK